MAKPAKESWQVWYWAIKVWCSYLDFSNSIPIPHPLTQNYQPDIKISRDIQPLLHFAVSSNILLTTSILLCHALWQVCRFVSQHQNDCRLQKVKKRYSGCLPDIIKTEVSQLESCQKRLRRRSMLWLRRMLRVLAFAVHTKSKIRVVSAEIGLLETLSRCSMLNKCECRIAMIHWRVLPLLIFNN